MNAPVTAVIPEIAGQPAQKRQLVDEHDGNARNNEKDAEKNEHTPDVKTSIHAIRSRYLSVVWPC